jgi:uncharacterized protein (TIGR02246 family)
LALALGLPGAACARPAQRTPVAADPVATDTIVRGLFAAVDARWNARDAAGLAELHTENADISMPGGSRMRGREAIRDLFGRSFAASPPSLRHRTVVEETSLLAPGVLGADGRFLLEDARGDSTVVVRRLTFTAVVVRAPAEWRVRLVRIHLQPTDRGTAPSPRER